MEMVKLGTFLCFLMVIPSALGFLCQPGQLSCFNGRQCINNYEWCDGNSDCRDSSDEAYCDSYDYNDCDSSISFKCDNGLCIPSDGQCDGYPSCKDGSDELDCACEEILKETGSMAYKALVGKKRSSKCWKIKVSSTKYLVLNITNPILYGSGCSDASLIVTGDRPGSEPIKFCPRGITPSIIERFDTTEIRYQGKVRNQFASRSALDSFHIHFVIADVLCKRSDSIVCSPNSCVAPEKECDGVEDCDNGADERSCERGVSAVPGVNITLNRSISWLKEQRNAAWGWRDDTHRAVVALYLAHGANFNGTDQEEDLTAKQLELQMTTAILRNETDLIPPNQLAMYVNALLVICHDPRNFYGFNLVKILREQMEISTKGDHPLPYLALCNANETLSDAAIEKLSSILRSSSEHSFLTDVQSVAVMALSCMSRKGNFSYLKININETTNRFKKGQNEDGSFGNIYTTALVIQALLSSGNEEAKDWDLKAAIEFLQRRQNKANGSFDDFLATTLILPILNAKSLSDIDNINCMENLKMPRDGNPVSDIELRMGQKMSVKYCLYLGDEKDQMHPIALRTPTNITVLDVMRLAAEADPKYRFEYQSSNDKLYIYKINGISNDPEDGKFWLLFTKTGNETLKITSKSPDKLTVYDKDNIVMWYRSAAIEQTS